MIDFGFIKRKVMFVFGFMYQRYARFGLYITFEINLLLCVYNILLGGGGGVKLCALFVAEFPLLRNYNHPFFW